MFLFLIASGLSLIFGVLRVLNFAHGAFYMLGAYLAYQAMLWLGPGPGRFWLAALGAALGIALLGGVVERVLFRHLYGKEELYQLLFTYALGLILSDAAKIFWGTAAKIGEPATRAQQLLLALRRDHPPVQPVHHRTGAEHRTRLLVRAATHARGPLHPGRRPRPRDARRARGQRRRALHVGVHAGFVP